MDPVTHTLAGASLARAGLHHRAPLATATLVLGANAPDIDIFVSVAGSYASLALRRGWTHGPLAAVVLPFVVAGFVLGWDRWVRRRRSPGSPPAPPSVILLLAFIGVASHVPLDWLNTYGVRLLMPFSPRWFYGDAVFIVDPWLWLLLGGGLAVAGPRTRRGDLGWGGLALVLSLPVLLAPQVPAVARWTWGAGVLLVAALRVRHPRDGVVDGPGPMDPPARRDGPAPGRPASAEARGAGEVRRVPGGPSSRADRPALAATLLAAAYIVLMVLASAAGERLGEQAARASGIEGIREVLYSPRPSDPFAADLVVITGDDYRRGSFRWFPPGDEPRTTLQAGAVLPRGDWSHPAVIQALEHPDVRHYLVWSRFPFVRTEAVTGGTAVTVGDARYPGGTAGGGLEGVRIVVPDRGGASPPP